MKKILPMILLLSFSLPVMAAEVNLMCKKTQLGTGIVTNDEFSFDAAARTVDSYPTNTICDPKSLTGHELCVEARIGDIEVSRHTYYSAYEMLYQLDRTDGGYKVFMRPGYEGELELRFSGNCTKFQQQF